MSRRYCFQLRATHHQKPGLFDPTVPMDCYEPRPLAEVDDDLCVFYGATPDPDRFSRAFGDVVEAGFAMLFAQGGDQVTEAHFDWLMTQMPDLFPAERALLEYAFITGPYIFEAWG
jgi:hypothetical protein